MELIRMVTQRVKLLASSLYDTETRAMQLRSSMISETSIILNNAKTIASSTQRSPSPACSDSISHGDKRYPCPPYIASAYKWLRHNIHKPYPTVEEIQSICANSDTSEKRIRHWFISARRRMGWSKIAKEHFHSDREDMADAAYRALVEPDPKRPIEAKLMFEFVKMEVVAEGMYSSAFKPSQFAGSLGTTVVGMSTEHKACLEEMRQQAIQEENIRRGVEHKMKRQRVTKRNGSQRKLVSLYPSPERSSCSSPEPTLAFSETEEDDMAISISGPSTGPKRCRSPSSDTLFSHADKRPGYVICPADPHILTEAVFHRSATATSPTDPSMSLPSPSASADNILVDSASWDVLPINPKPPTPSHTRKRRLSDADAQGPPKRPRSLAVGPRLHAASDPLPMANTAVQNWNMSNFEFNFELPSTVTSQPWDPSVPIDVEFFNWTNDHTFSRDFFSPNTSCKSTMIVLLIHC
jgi:C-terminal domain of homeodomain 1/Homeobox KN domain